MPPKEITQKAKVLIYNPLEHDDIMTNLTKELSVRNHFSWEENLDEDKQCYDITKNCTSFNTRIVGIKKIKNKSICFQINCFHVCIWYMNNFEYNNVFNLFIVEILPNVETGV